MTTPAPPDDGPLVSRARAGDREAMDQLLRLHQSKVHALCRRITGNDADALDATQEALIAIVRGLPRFDGRSAFSTWVYRVATNACLDELRRRNRRPLLGAAGDHGADVDRADPSAVDPAEAAAGADLIDHALRDLSIEFRAAVVLRDLCQLDYAEIGEVLDIPPGTVRSRIARGRAHVADTIRGNQRTTSERHRSTP